jgi:hypothetical protein
MDARALHQRVRRRGRTAVARRFGIDARALAALRISLGVLVFADLLLRAQDLTAFYTDAGVLPRELLREQFPVFARLSLHAVSGSAWLQAFLFLVAGASALALLVGYRTTPATVVSFVLLVSLHARNPLVLNAGDSVLRRLLFWSIFLPLGRRWSVDAIRAERDRIGVRTASLRDRVRDATPSLREAFDGKDTDNADTRMVVGVASAALLVQVVIVYTANAAFKLRGDSWVRGDAIRYALGLDQLTVLLGDALTQFPLLLGFLDRVWLGLLVSSVMLVLLTGRPRAVFASLFVGMHVGMALTMRLGIFPFVSIAALIPFLPPEFWNVAERRFRKSRVGRWGTAIRSGARELDAGLRRIERGLPLAPRPENLGGLLAGAPPAIARWKRRLQPPVVGGLLALVLVWNAATLGVVGLPGAVDDAVDPEEHRWDMFAPEPRTNDGWYVVPGELSSGERRDVLHGSAVEWDRPPDLAQTYPNVRWFKYLVDLRRDGNEALQRGFGEYLCERWNRTHETTVERVTIYYVEQEVRLDAAGPAERVELRQHSCSDGD